MHLRGREQGDQLSFSIMKQYKYIVIFDKNETIKGTIDAERMSKVFEALDGLNRDMRMASSKRLSIYVDRIKQ